MSEQNQRALILHCYVLLCCIRYTGMYMYPDLTTIHRYLCLQFFVPATYTGKYQIALYLNVTSAGYWYLVPVLLQYSSSYGTSTATKTKQMHPAWQPAGWWWDRNMLLVLQVPGTYACIVLRHDVNLQRHYTCKNTNYMWRYYDWLNPQCGATYDAGPCGVTGTMSVEI